MDRSQAGFRTGRHPRRKLGLHGAERLEARTLLSAVPGGPAATGIERALWHGRAVEARVDHWVGRLAVAPISGHNAVPAGGAVLQGSLSASHPGWHATSLAGGFLSFDPRQPADCRPLGDPDTRRGHPRARPRLPRRVGAQ